MTDVTVVTNSDEPMASEASTMDAVTVDLVERVTRLETRMDAVEATASTAAVVSEIALSEADSAMETAQDAAATAVDASFTAEDAQVTAEAAIDSAVAIAEISEPTEDDSVVEEIVQDVPARKPNFWFAEQPFSRS